MAKTFPIMLEVEEIALGPVLRKLHEMAGIAKLHLDLGHGGMNGQKQMAADATQLRAGSNAQQVIIKLLLAGPKHVSEIIRAVGGSKARSYGGLHQLRKKGISEAGDSPGMHQLTAKARAELADGGGAVPALPAPVKRGPSGKRISPGAGQSALAAILAAGAKRTAEIRTSLAEYGISPKSVTGVLDRAKKAGLIKGGGVDGYELTAKGRKIEVPNG